MSGFPYGFVEANECEACHGYAGNAKLCATCATPAPLLVLDPICPLCKGAHDVGEILDGHGRDCGGCGRYLVAIAWDDGTMTMVNGGGNGIVDMRTGRQRTRARWRRQGRRGG